jgi:hypothetical protein
VELDPVEKRCRVILRIFEHALLKAKEAQITVVEERGVLVEASPDGGRAGGRRDHVLSGRYCQGRQN